MIFSVGLLEEGSNYLLGVGRRTIIQIDQPPMKNSQVKF